jgi:ribosome modulation factor
MKTMEWNFTQEQARLGYSDGLNGINRDFRNDDELSDAYIDGYQDGQRGRLRDAHSC